MICLREQLWGKAKAYLVESLAIDKQPETQIALARLSEAVGDEANAATNFREAALDFANRLNVLPALAHSAVARDADHWDDDAPHLR